MVLTRQIKCPQCGAPKDTVSDSVLVICDYCGSFISMETSQYFRGEGFAKLQQSQIARLVNPSAADARKMKVNREMELCRQRGDRDGFRVVAQEYCALMAVTDPEMVPGGGGDPEKLRDWASRTAKAQELMFFEPEVKAAYEEYSSLVQGLYRSEEPVADAHELYAAARRYYATLNEHPDYPFADAAGSEGLAKEMVRATVRSMESFLEKGVPHRIYAEVLGDEQGAGKDFSCKNCGAPLTPEEMEASRCPYCGGVIRVEEEDPWLANLLATWKGISATMPNEDTLAAGAINHPLASYWTSGRAPEADDVYAFLREAVGWLEKGVLIKQLENLSMAYSGEPELAKVMSELRQRLQGWVATSRPEPDPPPPPPPPAGSAESSPKARSPGQDPGQDPWVEQTVTMWEYAKSGVTKENLEMSLLSQALAPFYMGGEVRADQAVAFFEKAEPGYSKRKMKKAVALMRSASQQNPAMAAFLKVLPKHL
jgi:DNA-directed RNA polymerase subunit RPC12/RpoP